MTTFTPPTIEELQDQFPQYHIEGFIAQGGMGAVYLARQISLDRPVAIKILPQEFGEDKDYRFSFETEAKAMARLNHTNLVGIYDFGEIDGMLYIVMEYIPGRTLFDTANGQQVDEKEAARLISDMSEGLAHAHEAGMLHRDIKPANVLIDDEAKPKIVDFGLARPMGDSQTDGVVFGTPGYTAPEVMSNPYAVDHRSDIFSMGVMLYELLTGHLPGNPVIPASRASNTDTRFDAIISKSIHPNPAMRYGSAAKLSKDLDDLIENFDEPKTAQASMPGLVAAGRPFGSSVAGLASARPATLPSAKKSNVGVIIFTLFILVGGAVAMMVANSGPDGPSEEELAKIALAKKIELARQKEIEAERKRHAEEKRKKQLALEKEKQLAEERRIEREAEAERRAEARAKREKERKDAEALAKMEEQIKADKEALENKEEELVSEFVVEDYLSEKLDIAKEKLEGLQDKADDLVEPVFDKLERELKRAARRFAKGRRGQMIEDLVENYMENVRDKGEILDVPEGVHGDLRDEVDEILAEYREKYDEALEPLDEDKEEIRNSYITSLKEKQAELTKEKDEIGAATLDEPIKAVGQLDEFLKLFEEVEEEKKK